MGGEKNKRRSLQTLILSVFLFGSGLLFLLRYDPSISFRLSYGSTSLGRYKTDTTSNPNRNNKRKSGCSSIANNTICCDRTNYHSDVCFIKGDVRTDPSSSSILLHSAEPPSSSVEENIRPYTRKWEAVVMNRIPELHLKIVNASSHHCDVRHDVPAIFFSAGGYTGNVFHAFNNGLIPLYITSQHLKGKVIFAVLQYKYWWYTKYREILSELSGYPLIDFSNDTRTHCFPGAVIGLHFHGTLWIDPSRTVKYRRTIMDFHYMLSKVYDNPQSMMIEQGERPKLVIIARDATRVIENEGEVVELAKDVGFDVEVLRPRNTMPMDRIYRALSSCDVMIGVHGAALTHFLFMRPSTAFIQIVPLGIEKLAKTCYEEPAAKMGLWYKEYKILPSESSLYRKYGEGDPVVRDPESVKAKGWETTKGVYLEGQNVTLDLNHLRESLVEAFQYAVSERRASVQ